MSELIAQKEVQLGDPFKGFGPLGDPEGTGIGTFGSFLSTVIGLMTIVAIIWFVFLLFTGAIAIMGAGGDKTALEGARKRIATGLIGLVIVIAAVFFIDLLGFLIDIPLLNLGELFGRIQ